LFVVIKLKILKVMKIHGVFESFNLGKIKKSFGNVWQKERDVEDKFGSKRQQNSTLSFSLKQKGEKFL
jgi:hypothetical protein